MTREDNVLLGLAAGGANARFTPVQVQKLFFLIDREASHLVEGPHFNFVPYDYGPFDKSVYETLEGLSQCGLAVTQSTGTYRVYELTEAGVAAGTVALSKLTPSAREYIKQLSNWVRKLSFEQLVGTIYKKYPEMKEKSVFSTVKDYESAKRTPIANNLEAIQRALEVGGIKFGAASIGGPLKAGP